MRVLDRLKSAWQTENTHQRLLETAELEQIRQRVIAWISHSGSQSRPVTHRQSGDVPSVYTGIGLDYEESRPYQPGDDLRFMNWRVTARTGKPYIKVFREEKKPEILLIMDRRAAMRFGSVRQLKVTLAARCAAMAAFMAERHGLSVSGIRLEQDLCWTPSCTDLSSIRRMISDMSSPCPPVSNTGQEPSLPQLLKQAQARFSKGSTLVVLSDLQDVSEQDKSVLMAVACNFNVVAVDIHDPAELELPETGSLELGNMDDTRSCHINPAREPGKVYSNQYRKKKEITHTMLRQLGISCIPVSTNQSADDVLPLLYRAVSPS